MKFQTRPRFESGASHRIMPPEQTIKRVRPYMRHIGVTRVADTTGLDNLGMHIFSAIRPTDMDLDGISVFNGKGLTKADSHAGAMMEAIERYRAESWLGPVYHGTYAQMVAAHPEAKVMDPESMRLQRRKPFDPSTPLDWVDGWDLINDRPALVATTFVLCPYRGPAQAVWESSSHGLASGNCIEEAVTHALAEVIERDSYTIAMVRTELAPRFTQVLDRIVTHECGPLVDTDELFPCIDLTTLPAKVQRLVRTAERAGAEVMLRNMSSDMDIPVFLAFLRTVDENGVPFPTGGFGCDPNPTIAAIRAITEAAQGRNVMIQGVREDAKAIKQRPHKVTRVLWDPSEHTVPFDSVPSYHNDDILDDLKLMIERIQAVGITEAYAVDLTDPEIPASVARVLVPEAECWFITDFKPDTCRLGWRAGRYLVGAD